MRYLKPILIGFVMTFILDWLVLPFVAALAAGPLLYFDYQVGYAILGGAAVLEFLMLIGLPIALLLAKWDTEPSLDSNQQGLTIRGDLPSWAWFYTTPDERLPGGTYEPTVAGRLAARGPFLTSWYWLGIRNRMHGLAAAFALPTSMPWSPEPGYYDNGSLWWLRYPLFNNTYQFKTGWRTYYYGGGWKAVPCFTITKA
jgi:hypothetical protein